MALPPGFIDELRARLPLSAVVGRKVTWDRRKSQPAKGDFWAPCPFHQEKTASFHVDDRKGFYHCFGCNASGDLISFVRETENLGFMEAVAQLARDAGLALPERDPEAAARATEAERLAGAMERAVRAYGLAFRSAAGQRARDYALRRGMTAETLARFEIGYAPPGWHHLAEIFAASGETELAIAAGLLKRPDDGGRPHDRFRDRLMFPIRDPRGRCIGFGGRALQPDDKAKYLNSPETPLFSKGRVLFNHGPAREAAAKAGTLIVAEGYMDVVALVQAGFGHAVAPLGTAVTETQLSLLWQMADEPVIALDGDAAGQRAALGLIDLALPLLKPGKSLRFCLLPDKQDPDEVLKAGGAPAMAAVLAGARPMIEIAWERAVDAQPLDTPERRAAFDERLRALIGRIADPSVREHYRADLRARRRRLFAPEAVGRPPAPWSREPLARGAGRSAPWSGRARVPPPRRDGPDPSTRNSALARAARGGAGDAVRLREATILWLAASAPGALAALEDALEEMPLCTPALAPFRDALIAEAMAGLPASAGELRARLVARLGRAAVETVGALADARAAPLAGPGRPVAQLVEVLDQAIQRHAALVAREAELSDAARDFGEATGEDWTRRLLAAVAELAELDRSAAPPVDAAASDQPSEIARMLEEGAYRAKKRV